MHIQLQALLLLSSLLTVSSAISISQSRSRQLLPLPLPLPLTSTLIHQFPIPTWIENVAVTSTNAILTTILTAPEIYYINPTVSILSPLSPSTASLLHTFTSSRGLLGITELRHNEFYVLGSNKSILTNDPGFNTSTLYSLDLTHYNPQSNTGAVIKTVATLPLIKFGNGVTTLSASENIILISDANTGALWLVNTTTGAYRIALQIPEMAPDTSSPIAIGINGVRVLPSSPQLGSRNQGQEENKDIVWIYFANSSTGRLYRILFSISSLSAVGTVDLIANISPLRFDDFAIDARTGYIYLAGPPDRIWRVGVDGGKIEVALGGANSTAIIGSTSLAVGRGREGCGNVYAVTNGGLKAGGKVEGGKVVGLKVES